MDGTGSGIVTSTPSGIECGSDCSERYDENTVVTLTATEDSNSIFMSWSGCDSFSDNTCTVDMGSDKSVTATFNKVIPVQLKKGILLKKKDAGGKDEITLILKNCSNMSDAISELAKSSAYISISMSNSNLYSSERIPGSKFKPNRKKTTYKYKEKSPERHEKHKVTLLPLKDKIILKIKKATIREITNSGESATGSTKEIRVRITIGSRTYEAVNTWTVKKDNKRKAKLIFR